MSTSALLGTAKATSGNTVITVAAAVAIGDLIVIFGQGNANITAVAISDDAAGAGTANSYTTSIGANTGAPVICGYRSYCVATRAIPVGGQITINQTGGKSRQSQVAVVIKNPAASPVDKVNASTGGNATPTAGATGTLAQADEFILFAEHGIQTTDPGVTGAGWTKLGSITTTAGSNDRTSIVYIKTVTATTTTTPAGTVTTASNWSAALMTVKTQADPTGYVWSVWNGTTEDPLTLDGVWNGTTIDDLTTSSVV